MSNLTPETHPESQEPFIPPQALLGVAVVAFVAALIVAFTQPEFGVVGYGALALGVLALLAWALMAPDQARAALTGRTARFGGLSFFVTLVLLVALVIVYIFVRNQSWRVDLTQRDTFSLNDQTTEAIRTLAADPSVPGIRLLAFYPAAMAGRRDGDAVLFDDYVAKSDGKISYEFIDPNRSPQIAQQYGITNDGQIAVVPLDGSGQPIVDEAEPVTFLSQDELTNAILKVSAQGDFRVYVLNVEGGLGLTPGDQGSMSVMVQQLTEQLDWTIEEVSFLDLLRSDSTIDLDDPNVDGQVLMIVGGSEPLGEQERAFLTNYLDEGGDAVIMAGNSLNDEQTSLATDPALSDYLAANFGLSFRNDVVIDQTQFIQNPLFSVTDNFGPGHFITTTGISPGSAAIFELAHSIELAETPPANVIITDLVFSGDDAYGKTDLDAVLGGTVDRAEGDLEGPLLLGAVAENADTGARLVVFGSTSLVQDTYLSLQQSGVANLQLAFNTLLWETDFNDFFQRTTVFSDQRPEDTPVFADANTLRTITFVTLILLPFGVLAIGLLVWWNSRERARMKE